MLEEKIDELVLALADNTNILQKLHDLKAGDMPAIDNMKANIAAMEEGMDDAEVEQPVKKSKKKSSKKKTAKKTAAVEQTDGSAATANSEVKTPEVVDPPLAADKVQQHLRGIASKLTDTSKLFALIQKHGAQQFSDLDPSVYPQLIADAEQLVEDGA